MASERSQRRLERLLDEADDAVTQLDWDTVSRYVLAWRVPQYETYQEWHSSLRLLNSTLALAENWPLVKMGCPVDRRIVGMHKL